MTQNTSNKRLVWVVYVRVLLRWRWSRLYGFISSLATCSCCIVDRATKLTRLTTVGDSVRVDLKEPHFSHFTRLLRARTFSLCLSLPLSLNMQVYFYLFSFMGLQAISSGSYRTDYCKIGHDYLCLCVVTNKHYHSINSAF